MLGTTSHFVAGIVPNLVGRLMMVFRGEPDRRSVICYSRGNAPLYFLDSQHRDHSARFIRGVSRTLEALVVTGLGTTLLVVVLVGELYVTDEDCR